MTQFNQPDDMPTPNQLRIAELEETIADLRERHVQFIWAIHALLFSATHSLNTDDYVEADNRIWDAIRLCDAELGKEQSNE